MGGSIFRPAYTGGETVAAPNCTGAYGVAMSPHSASLCPHHMGLQASRVASHSLKNILRHDEATRLVGAVAVCFRALLSLCTDIDLPAYVIVAASASVTGSRC